MASAAINKAATGDNFFIIYRTSLNNNLPQRLVEIYHEDYHFGISKRQINFKKNSRLVRQIFVSLPTVGRIGRNN